MNNTESTRRKNNRKRDMKREYALGNRLSATPYYLWHKITGRHVLNGSQKRLNNQNDLDLLVAMSRPLGYSLWKIEVKSKRSSTIKNRNLSEIRFNLNRDQLKLLLNFSTQATEQEGLLAFDIPRDPWYIFRIEDILSYNKITFTVEQIRNLQDISFFTIKKSSNSDTGSGLFFTRV